MFNDLHKALEMWQYGTAHEDGYLLANLDTSVTSLPWLLALTDGLQEWQKSRNAEGGSNNGKCTSCRVTYVLIHVVNIWTHCGNHCCQTSSLHRHNNWWYIYTNYINMDKINAIHLLPSLSANNRTIHSKYNFNSYISVTITNLRCPQ